MKNLLIETSTDGMCGFVQATGDVPGNYVEKFGALWELRFAGTSFGDVERCIAELIAAESTPCSCDTPDDPQGKVWGGYPDGPQCGQPDRDKQLLALLEPEIIYYGPHACEECGKMICRSSRSQGPETLRGFSFDYPDGPIYPNTNWTRHDCNKAGEPATNEAQMSAIVTRRLPREER